MLDELEDPVDTTAALASKHKLDEELDQVKIEEEEVVEEKIEVVQEQAPESPVKKEKPQIPVETVNISREKNLTPSFNMSPNKDEIIEEKLSQTLVMNQDLLQLGDESVEEESGFQLTLFKCEEAKEEQDAATPKQLQTPKATSKIPIYKGQTMEFSDDDDEEEEEIAYSPVKYRSPDLGQKTQKVDVVEQIVHRTPGRDIGLSQEELNRIDEMKKARQAQMERDAESFSEAAVEAGYDSLEARKQEVIARLSGLF